MSTLTHVVTFTSAGTRYTLSAGNPPCISGRGYRRGSEACLLRRRRRMKMKSEAEIMPTTDTVSASHSGALATPCRAPGPLRQQANQGQLRQAVESVCVYPSAALTRPHTSHPPGTLLLQRHFNDVSQTECWRHLRRSVFGSLPSSSSISL